MGLQQVTIGEPIGRGGMGTVHAGDWNGRPVAVKVLDPEHAGELAYVRAFQTEVRAMASLAHPAIVQVLDFGRVTEGPLPIGSPYVVMERADGSLAGVQVTGWAQVRVWLVQLLEGLAHAHARGIIHRDLKPANVLLSDGRVKIVDFGLARAFEALSVGHHERPAGTPGYMPPEQRQGRWRDVGPWTDLYALGRLAFDLIALPEGGSIPVPERFPSWMARLRQEEAHDRYRRAAEALADLERLGPAGTTLEIEGGLSPSADSDVAITQPYFEDEDHVVEILPEPLPIGEVALPAQPIPTPEPGARGTALTRLRIPEVHGREPLQHALWDAVKRAHAGRIEIVSLEGPAGVGKRALAMWLCHQIHETGAGAVNLATHHPQPGPREGLAGMLARELRCLDVSRTDAFRRVSRFVQTHPHPRVASMDDWEVAALLAIMSPALGTADRDTVSIGDQDQRFQLVARFIERDAGHRLPLVWLENLHDGPETVAWLEWLSQRGGRMLVVATVEGPSLDPVLDRVGATRIAVQPYTTAENVTRMREAFLVSEVVALALAEAARSDLALAGAALEDWTEQGLVDVAGRLAGSTPRELDAEALWGARLERALENRDRFAGAAVAAAAVLGIEVDAVRWRDVLRRARIRADPDLSEALREAGLVFPVGIGGAEDFRFVSESARRVALERAGASLSRLHRAAALSFHVEPETVLRRAFHLERAGEARAAVLALKEAVSVLLVVGHRTLLVAVVCTLESVLEREELPEASLWAAIGRLCLDSAGDTSEALLERGVALVERATPWPTAHTAASYFAGRLAQRLGRNDEASAFLEPVAGLAGTDSDLMAVEAAAVLAGIRYHQGRLHDALDLMDYVVERRGDPIGVVNAAILKSLVWARLGDEERATQELLAVEESSQMGGWLTRAQYANALGERARRLGQLEEAAAHYAVAFHAALPVEGVNAWLYRLNQTLTDFQRGEAPHAAERLDEAIEHLDALSAHQFASVGRLLRLVAAARDGDEVAWDAHVGGLGILESHGIYEADLALAGELAAEAMLEHDPERAEVASRFAARQRAALGEVP